MCNQNGPPNFRNRSALASQLRESPFHQVMGYELGELNSKDGYVEITLPFRTTLKRMKDGDEVHGGAIASLIDVAGNYAMKTYLNKSVPTVNLRIDYLRPAVRSNLRASASVRKAGRTIGVADVQVVDESGIVIALGRGVFSTR